MKTYYVYILTNKKCGCLYTGITGNLALRLEQHKYGLLPGFTKKYGVKKLVYCEGFNNVWDAIHREKCIKKWYRQWKIDLIEQMNPVWEDLSSKII